MTKMLDRYRRIPKAIYYLVALEFLVQLVNAGFLLILNLFLRKKGYTDPEVANLTAYRYLPVLIFSFPVGILIRSRPLKPFFIATALLLPLSSVALVEFVNWGWQGPAKAAFFMWGVGLMFMQVCALPFILRNGTKATESEAISLNYATFSMGQLISGGIIFGLAATGTWHLGDWTFSFDEYHLLLLISLLPFGGLFFALKLTEKRPERSLSDPRTTPLHFWKDYDWGVIAKALIPTTILAVGAGLTIPFLNLFFNKVFGLNAQEYALLGLISAFVVMVAALYVPFIKRAFGYKIAITLSQTLAVLCLFLLASTEQFKEVPGMVWIAMGLLLLRNPLMNMAGPMSNELVMNYVGVRNQELVTALTHSIWSGAWVISAKAFEAFRQSDLAYFQIFYLTGALYSIGVVLYFFLIRSYEKKSPPSGH